MKKLIAGLLIFCSAALALADSETRFVALVEWAQELNNKATMWNEQCHENHDAPGCDVSKMVLEEQFTFFIEIANRFSVPETKDCRAALQPRVIAHTVRLFKWNLSCAGQTLTDQKEIIQCKAEKTAITAELIQLKKDTDVCMNRQKL
jgi:hypothetical protein